MKWFGFGIPPSEDVENFWHNAFAKNHPKQISQSLCGKWLIFVPRAEMDKHWEKIAGHTIVNNLGISSKIATIRPSRHAKGSETTVICVHTYNYKDKIDVIRVRKMLLRLKYDQTLYYKTDKATINNVYGENSWTYRSSGEDLIER